MILSIDEFVLSIRFRYVCKSLSKFFIEWFIVADVKRILNDKTYLDTVTTEIGGIKLPFHTKSELINYVKSHIGDKVMVTFNTGKSEVRTLESISNTALRTKKVDGSQSVTELKGVKYNDTGFYIDYDTGVSVVYDFVNCS